MPSFLEDNNMLPKKIDKGSKTAEKILSSHMDTGNPKRDKRIDVRVTTKTYEEFTQITRYLGTTNSSVVSMLITEYIREHKDILNEQ